MQQPSRATYAILFLAFFKTLILTVTHHLALLNDWYWVYRWIDIPMHLLGGFLIGSLIIFSYCRVPYIGKFLCKFSSPTSVVLLSVFFVALSWEVFEVWAGISIHEPNYLFDTVKDMFMGMVGALFSLLFVRIIKKGEEEK